MNIKKVVIALLFMILLFIPIFWLVLQEGTFFTLLRLIIYLSILVVINVIIYKTGGYGPYQNRSVRIVTRIQRTIGSGLLTALVIGITVTLLTNPLPNHFWIFLIILFVIGAIIGDTLQRLLLA